MDAPIRCKEEMLSMPSVSHRKHFFNDCFIVFSGVSGWNTVRIGTGPWILSQRVFHSTIRKKLLVNK